jgi:AraC-like DNA-binding protein
MVLLAPACVCCLLLTACTVSPKRPETAMGVHPTSDISANTEQIRVRMRALVQPMSSVIVTSADQIMSGTTDPAIRREALLWKIEAVPAVRESLFHASPMMSIADAWVLTFQMRDYFEKGPGATALGDAHTIAVTTSQNMEAELARVAATLTKSGDVSRVRDYARDWAAAHPIQHSIAGRESLLSRVPEGELAASFSVTEAAGNLTVSVDDLSWRLEIYSAQLPEQSRWQAELFLMDFLREHQLEKAVPLAENTLQSAGHAAESLDRTIPALERSLAVLEKTPAMVATERETTMKALAAELTRSMTFVQQERMQTLKQITAERTAAVRDVGDAVVEQRKLLAQDIDGIATRAVDRAFLRATLLCAAVLLLAFCGIILLILFAKWLFSPPRASGGPRRSETAPGQPL